MDVAVTEFRSHLSEWLARARDGDEVVITDHGVPVARVLGVDATTALERLTEEGVIGRALVAQRPQASGRVRPKPKSPVADLVSQQRR